ncbi:Os07g0298700 [Oryza sativa Japonica Group]|uniref:Os07g0298700 protein n=1 Tax=Oryza sativa subsp. japonica TaxID=39947 RepID=A0A0P0X4R9_ORYSJ|nr:Os07g0298700 [Oryza sativa Japonica Group]
MGFKSDAISNFASSDAQQYPCPRAPSSPPPSSPPPPSRPREPRIQVKAKTRKTSSKMADSDSPATWELSLPQSEGYVIELHRMLRRLRYPGFPSYRVRQCGPVWEARVEIHPRVPSKLDYSFQTRHHRDLPETAMQDAAREAFLRLSSIHRAELVSTEFAHHPFREEGNSVCTVQDTPCCYNPIVTRLSR